MQLEEELASCTATVRSGTQKALKHIAQQYQTDRVQMELQRKIQKMLFHAANRGEDHVWLKSADFDAQMLKQCPTHIDCTNMQWRDKYNEECLRYGTLLKKGICDNQVQPKWAKDLYERVKCIEERRALCNIAESLGVRFEAHDNKYKFNWQGSASDAYYNIVKGPIDVYTQYQSNEADI